jgi:hypothetical protein
MFAAVGILVILVGALVILCVPVFLIFAAIWGVFHTHSLKRKQARANMSVADAMYFSMIKHSGATPENWGLTQEEFDAIVEEFKPSNDTH